MRRPRAAPRPRGPHLAIPAAVTLAFIGLLAIWPAFLMPHALYQLVYGWRYPTIRACGDATLTDAGPASSADRYVADYGYLPLDAETNLRFKLCALPREWMVLGLDLELPGQDKLGTEIEQFRTGRVSAVEVAISLTDESGRAVVAHDGPLEDHWIWSYGYPPASAFLYAQDTMFVPQSRAAYELRISIWPSDSSTGTRARLVVKGGGWKAPPPPDD